MEEGMVLKGKQHSKAALRGTGLLYGGAVV